MHGSKHRPLGADVSESEPRPWKAESRLRWWPWISPVWVRRPHFFGSRSLSLSHFLLPASLTERLNCCWAGGAAGAGPSLSGGWGQSQGAGQGHGRPAAMGGVQGGLGGPCGSGVHGEWDEAFLFYQVVAPSSQRC